MRAGNKIKYLFGPLDEVYGLFWAAVQQITEAVTILSLGRQMQFLSFLELFRVKYSLASFGGFGFCVCSPR